MFVSFEYRPGFCEKLVRMGSILYCSGVLPKSLKVAEKILPIGLLSPSVFKLYFDHASITLVQKIIVSKDCDFRKQFCSIFFWLLWKKGIIFRISTFFFPQSEKRPFTNTVFIFIFIFIFLLISNRKRKKR